MSTPYKLKISKRMNALLAAMIPEGGTVALIGLEVAAGRADKDGAVMIEVPHTDAIGLLGIATGRMSALDAELKTAAPEDKHKLLGEHSAWRALARQLPQVSEIPNPEGTK